MSTMAAWNLRGSPHTLRTQRLAWNMALATWDPPRTITSVTFDSNGQALTVAHHNRDGSLARQSWLYDEAGRLLEARHWTNDDVPTRVVHTYDAQGRPALAYQVTPDDSRREIESSTYDAAGQRTKVIALPEMPPGLPEASIVYGIEGTDQAFGAPGAVTLKVVFDARALPAVGIFLDAASGEVSRVTFTRDDVGRLIGEEMRFGGESFFAAAWSEEPLPDEARAHLKAFAEVAFAGNVFASTTRVYDASGLLLEKTSCFGRMSEERTRYVYNDKGDVVGEVTVGWRQEINTDEGGGVVQSSRTPSTQYTQFEYRYDPHGNWLERAVSTRDDSRTEFTPSNVEQREISYHGPRPAVQR